MKSKSLYLQTLLITQLGDRPVRKAVRPVSQWVMPLGTTWHAGVATYLASRVPPLSLSYLRKIIFVRRTGRPNADPTARPAQATGWRCLVDIYLTIVWGHGVIFSGMAGRQEGVSPCNTRVVVGFEFSRRIGGKKWRMATDRPLLFLSNKSIRN
jgi:hypothetical protein